jgi:aryl-alcohol dehydrogenase-like predicted oxidoreductase
MTFGEDWGWGASREESRRIFEAYVATGGNFIDTANNYTNGTSERFVGEFVAADRDRFVIATKYTLNTRADDPNAGGNHRKNLVRSLDGSLKRLGVEYVDLLWLHAWDGMTPVEEVMRALDDQVRAGKVGYVGVSDTPAWIIARANALAEANGWTPFVAVQAPYNLIRRDLDREIMPMARQLDLAVTAWAPIAGGVLSGKYNQGQPEVARLKAEAIERRRIEIAELVVTIAREVARTPAQVAINWVRQRPGVVIPILGARTLDQIQDNLGSLEFTLDAERLSRLDAATRIDLGFPHDFLAGDHVRQLAFGETYGRIENHRA